MLICQRNADHYNITDCDSDHNWSASTISYSNIQELPTFITRHRQAIQHYSFTIAADPSKLQGKQLATYNLVRDHMETNVSVPLRMIVSGTAGTGKSYLINCLRVLLREKVCVAAPNWRSSIQYRW